MLDLETLCKDYEAWLRYKSRKYEEHGYIFYDEQYKMAEDILGKRKYRADTIETFSLYLKKYESERDFEWSGWFLSAIINHSQDDKFNLITNYRDKLLWAGYRNKKEIIIHGDVGGYLGDSMENGKILVYGNAEERVGQSMKNGEIIIKGDALYGLGLGMEGGKIIIKRDVKGDVGDKMRGGEILIKGSTNGTIGHGMTGGVIRIYGKIKRISSLWKGGKIFRNDNLIRG